MTKQPERPKGDTQKIDRCNSGPAVVGRESVAQGISSSPPTPDLHRDAQVSPERAARIALQRALTLASSLPLHDRTVPAVYSVRDSSEERVRDYGVYNAEPAWRVSVPWFDGLDGTMLRSSRVIVVSKHGGSVLYDGSASDEG